MYKTADAIIIGGGIVGPASGYYLAKQGMRVALFEKEYLCSGSTGRCIGGIRQQFSSETTIRVAMESVNLFTKMEEELGIGVDWYPGGYIFLAHSEEMKQNYLSVIELQKSLGLGVEFISPEKTMNIVPSLNPEGILGAAYCKSDGQANPFLVVKGYTDMIKRLEGNIFTYTRVTKINVRHSRVVSIETENGDEYFAPIVLNAAGPSFKEVGTLVHIDLPTEPERHEALITEGVERILEPMLVDYRPDGCYFNQKIDTGQFIGCYTPDPKVVGDGVDSSFEFIKEMSKRMIRLLPVLRDVRVIRQWAGSYTMTPDGNPIIDRTEIDGFYVAGGMCGHGFMLGPSLGKLVAELITTGKTSIPIDEFSLTRDFGRKEVMK